MTHITHMTRNRCAEMIGQAIEERGAARTMFTGRSMKPTLSEGMRLAVEKIEPRMVKPADIIFYNRQDQMVVHRVIRIMRKDGKAVFVTKGDNQAYIDCDYVPEDNLVGIVQGAFFEDEPKANVLINSFFIRVSYLAIGNLVLFAMQLRRYIPRSIRMISKYFVGSFFFIFKKSIHAAYLGIRYGHLFFRRHSCKIRQSV